MTTGPFVVTRCGRGSVGVICETLGIFRTFSGVEGTFVTSDSFFKGEHLLLLVSHYEWQDKSEENNTGTEMATQWSVG